jgi:predicted permease
VANLLLVRASERRREIAVRASLGASRTQIAMQVLAEALTLSLAGGLLGISLASWMLRSLVAMVPVEIATTDFSLNRPVPLLTLEISLFTGIVFGLLPALGSSAPDLTTSLKEGGRSATAGESRNRLRSALAAAEIGFAVVLAVGAGLLLKSFANLQRVNPGFQPPSVITMRISLPEARYRDSAVTARFWDQLLASALQSNGVEAAGLTSFLPLTNTDSQTSYVPEGETRPVLLADRKWVDIFTVSAGYFAGMQIPLRQGRTFEATDDVKHPAVVVIDTSLAQKHWAGRNSVGKRIEVSGKMWTVVGVAGHVKPYGLDASEHVQIYMPYRQTPDTDMSLAVRTSGNWAVAVDRVRQTVRQLDPAAGIFDVKPMQQWVDDSTSRRRFTTLLLEMFAGLALLLAALGVYGVMSFSVAQRSHEMGIRLALGARPAGLKRMVVRQGLMLCAIGLGAGLAAALALARTMSAVLFEVQSFDPPIFAATAALLCAVAGGRQLPSGRRASRTDPMNTLRYE